MDTIARRLRAELGPVDAWRGRAEQIAALLADSRLRPPFVFDVQRAFGWFPPETAAGRGLFRLAEALLRTPDRRSRRALLAEHVPALRGEVRAALALPWAEWGVSALGDEFVYAQDIDAALRRASRAMRRERQARFSFDLLGEGVKTAEAAAHCAARYSEAVSAIGRQAREFPMPQRYGVSVKLSSIHERYDAASFARVRGEILGRLLELCGAAAQAGIGLTLDAEESERAPLLLELFSELALRPELLGWSGLGMALQAYRTGALETLDAILQLARARTSRGGQPLTLRLVKGAYWDAEVKRAQELGLERYPVFTEKHHTDLGYLVCARRLLEHAELVAAQIATHNPITLGCVLALAEAATPSGMPRAFEVQRLHGMGRALERALASACPQLGVRLYAPVGRKSELLAYLARRLLENAASTSYVRQAAKTADARALLGAGFAFLDPAERSGTLPLPTELHMPERRVAKGFDPGEPAALASLAQAIEAARRRWRAEPMAPGIDARVAPRRVVSPARPDVEIGEVRDATEATARAAVECAYAARADWANRDVARRAALLDRLADLIEADAPQLMALCVWEAGKTIADALSDVREAVDFCRYYAQQARRCLAPPRALAGPVGERNVLTLHGRGVFVCISPWNFPVAIFTGQVAAALVAGNAVVAKPAEQASLAAHRVGELVREAGFPPGAFHLVPGAGETVGQALVSDSRIAGVAFTGSGETARAIQRALARRDGAIVPFIAETGGVNAMLVDSTALPEQVVDAVVSSAFRSAGQRCSSLRVLLLQDEIAPAVLELLRGAMAALRVGDPSDPATDVGPVIDAGARAALAGYVAELRGRARLIAEAGPVPDRGHYVAPVAFELGSMREVPGERFGPVLHVVRYAIEDLDRVVDDINATGYGLTLGVHTRLDSRAERIRRRAAVGNLYVNRNMIGAVVGVQPFGGEGLSGTGPKAGGPHYLARFVTERVYTVNTAAAGGDLDLVAAGTPPRAQARAGPL